MSTYVGGRDGIEFVDGAKSKEFAAIFLLCEERRYVLVCN